MWGPGALHSATLPGDCLPRFRPSQLALPFVSNTFQRLTFTQDNGQESLGLCQNLKTLPPATCSVSFEMRVEKRLREGSFKMKIVSDIFED